MQDDAVNKFKDDEDANGINRHAILALLLAKLTIIKIFILLMQY
jgi:hypothetical protein